MRRSGLWRKAVTIVSATRDEREGCLRVRLGCGWSSCRAWFWTFFLFRGTDNSFWSYFLIDRWGLWSLIRPSWLLGSRIYYKTLFCKKCCLHWSWASRFPFLFNRTLLSKSRVFFRGPWLHFPNFKGPYEWYRRPAWRSSRWCWVLLHRQGWVC